jgi:hypothetical protein
VQESHLHIVPATSYILFEQSLAGWQSIHNNPYVHISGVSHYAATVALGVQVIVDCHMFVFVMSPMSTDCYAFNHGETENKREHISC